MVIDPKQEREYVGEALDIRSRGYVRREIDKRMQTHWAKWWVKGMNHVSRAKVAYELTGGLYKWWEGRKGVGASCFSFQAVMEEVDYYLPKSFWKHKRKKRQSAGSVDVDPDWDTFADWMCAFPQTIMRLSNESQLAQQRYRKYLSEKERLGR